VSWLELTFDGPVDPRRAVHTPDAAPVRLARCWQRALASGAAPEGPADEPVLSADRLLMHRERVGPVHRILDEVLSPSLRGFDERHFTVLFADRDGVVVHQRAGGAFAEVAAALRLQEGSVWDEATRGTNAIGTALAEGQPVVVRGAAHLDRSNHGLVCYSAPVLDPWGELIGVLDATSHVDAADPVVGAAVFAAARALEEALQSGVLNQAGGAVVERLLGRLRDPAVLVSPTGRITHANREALQRAPALGRPWSVHGDVARVRARAREVFGLDAAELVAAARGQVALPGLQVEPIARPDGRLCAVLVMGVAATAASPTAPEPPDPFAAYVGSDPQVVSVRSRAATLAPSSLPVVLLGETGTGKELIAAGLHAGSPRHAEPYVAVNCGAIAPSLLHSELFGYAPGAFTGADPGGRRGFVAQADGGTLFLDELGEMPAELQATLLRFLEDGTYHRVGDPTLRRADVRVVAATCRDLVQRVADGAFRADLYYRIGGAVLTLPPLRSRRDKALLCRTLLADLARETGLDRPPFLSSDALAHIEAQPWPGNVRQLRMALHHGLVMAAGARTLEPWHLPSATAAAEPSGPEGPAPVRQAPKLATTQADAVRQALIEADGNVSAAARALGVARSTVYRMAKRHGIDV